MTNEEIKQPLFDMDGNKALRPNGFNAQFFKNVWEIVGENVINVIQYFFSLGSPLREVNYTIIVFIPKCENLSSCKDYKSISCCNTIYKCISKIMANKLKNILPFVHQQSSSDFCGGKK